MRAAAQNKILDSSAASKLLKRQVQRLTISSWFQFCHFPSINSVLGLRSRQLPELSLTYCAEAWTLAAAC